MAKKKVSASEVRVALKRLKAATRWTNSGLISLLKGGGNSSKGATYEREFCKRLSLWWTGGERDDLFWRSQNSGGRATIRTRGGNTTAGQYGDVAATNVLGQPLMDLLTIELKRGYNEHTIHDILDTKPGGGVQVYEEFLSKAIKSHHEAGSYAWLLVHSRMQRDEFCWFPKYFLRRLQVVGCFENAPATTIAMNVVVRDEDKVPNRHQIVGCAWDTFLEEVEPTDLEGLLC